MAGGLQVRQGKTLVPANLTNEPVEAPDDAWRVVMAYARRWQVEMCYRPARQTWPWRGRAGGSGKTGSSCC